MIDLLLIKNQYIDIIERCNTGAYLFLVSTIDSYADIAGKYENQGFQIRDCIFYAEDDITYLVGVLQSPIKKNYAENVIENGCGGLNIGKCRIGDEKISIHNAPVGTFAGGEPDRGSETIYRESTGRYPANFILNTEYADVLDKQSGYSKSSPNKVNGKYKDNENGSTNFKRGKDTNYTDKGGASRYFKNVDSLYQLYDYLLDLGSKPGNNTIFIKI